MFLSQKMYDEVPILIKSIIFGLEKISKMVSLKFSPQKSHITLIDQSKCEKLCSGPQEYGLRTHNGDLIGW